MFVLVHGAELLLHLLLTSYYQLDHCSVEMLDNKLIIALLPHSGAPPTTGSQRQAPPTSQAATISPSTSQPSSSPFPPAGTSLSSTHQSQPQQVSFPEASIQQIMSAGFTRAEAIEELTRCNGNTTLALTGLLARSIKL